MKNILILLMSCVFFCTNTAQAQTPSSAIRQVQEENECFIIPNGKLSFLVPKYWFVENYESAIVLTNYDPSRGLVQGFIKMDLYVYANDERKTFEELLSFSPEEDQLILVEKPTTVNIHSHPFKRQLLRSTDDREVKIIELQTLHEGNIYGVLAYIPPGNDEAKAVQQVETIISSFKFKK